jgi:hypothetical protein
LPATADKPLDGAAAGESYLLIEGRMIELPDTQAPVCYYYYYYYYYYYRYYYLCWLLLLLLLLLLLWL